LPRRADISGEGKLTSRSQPEEKVKAISGVGERAGEHDDGGGAERRHHERTWTLVAYY